MWSHIYCDPARVLFLYPLPTSNLCDPVLVCISLDSQDTMIASFHVSWYVCQIHMGGLWSSCRVNLASEEESLGREKDWGKEENKNKQRLIVHKSSHSIVSGKPPTALADLVPMNRSNMPIHSLPLPFISHWVGCGISASPGSFWWLWHVTALHSWPEFKTNTMLEMWVCGSFAANLQRNRRRRRMMFW